MCVFPFFTLLSPTQCQVQNCMFRLRAQTFMFTCSKSVYRMTMAQIWREWQRRISQDRPQRPYHLEEEDIKLWRPREHPENEHAAEQCWKQTQLDMSSPKQSPMALKLLLQKGRGFAPYHLRAVLCTLDQVHLRLTVGNSEALGPSLFASRFPGQKQSIKVKADGGNRVSSLQSLATRLFSPGWDGWVALLKNSRD